MKPSLFGAFVPLDRVLEAVSLRIRVEDAEIEARRINKRFCPLDEKWQEMAERKAIRDALAASRAASLLLRALNCPVAKRAEWLELTDGVALRDDTVAKDGLRWLINQERRSHSEAVPVAVARWEATEAPTQVESAQHSRASRIGFDIEDLVALLDRERIPHALGTFEAEGGAPAPATKSRGTTAQSNGSKVHAITRTGKQCVISTEILEALRRAGGSGTKVSDVWAELHKMARSGEFPKIRLSPEKEVLEALGDSWAPYTRNAFRQFLGRRK